MPSRLDQFYRSIVFSRYFTKGWGKPENLKRICEFRKIVSNRETCYKLVSSDYPVCIEREEDGGNYRVIDGYFLTPFARYLPEVVPVECQKAYFQIIVPNKWQSENYKPIILQIAGTGDQYYWRRRNLIAKPLIKEAGIGSIILENPFYGKRKPKGQKRTILHNVCDIFVMGGCLIFESMVLFHLCERLGYGPLGVTGLSMGGHMASLIAACWPKPLVVVPCLSGTTSSHVFTQGVISRALNWDMLEKQFHSDSSYKEEIAKMINVADKDAYRAGKEFAARASNYSSERLANTIAQTAELTELIDGCAKYANNNAEYWGTKWPDNRLANSNQPCAPLATPAILEPCNSANERVVGVVENLSKTSSSLGLHSNKYETLASANLCLDVKTARVAPQPPACNGDADTNANAGAGLSDRRLQDKYDGVADTSGYSHYFYNYLAKVLPYSITSSTANAMRSNSNEATMSERQALSFMNGIMDEVTHLKNYPVPVDTSLVIAVCADDDAYVPQKGMSKLDEVWPGAQVRYVKGGHVRAYVQYQKNFRLAIVDAFAKYRSTYLRTF